MRTNKELNLAILETLNSLAENIRTLTHRFSPQTNISVDTPAERTAIRKLKDPNAPRIPRNAFTFFVEELGKDMRKKNKSINQRQVIAEAGRAWQKMDDKEKAPYAKLFRRDRMRYFAELEAYKSQKQKAESNQEEEQMESEENSQEESGTEAVQWPNKNERAINRSPSKKNPSEDEDHESVNTFDNEEDQDELNQEEFDEERQEKLNKDELYKDELDQDELDQDELDQEEEDPEKWRYNDSEDSGDENLLHESHDDDNDNGGEEASNKPIKTLSTDEEAAKEIVQKPNGNRAADDTIRQIPSDRGSDTDEEEGEPSSTVKGDGSGMEGGSHSAKTSKGSDIEEEIEGSWDDANGQLTDLKKTNDKATTANPTDEGAQWPVKKLKKRKLKNRNNNKHKKLGITKRKLVTS
ncbi:hypothetical protein BDB00DRAFT_791516 [Zychaea mexicana]|uniref:uncharacterized protein n=1 Tax=Zychaea mexicana TaxID=64656 RepID=UPI0022FEC262|nr:uncharacterized protein BDB00DRAFT_791516 [Zychaea mexicana]KAI9488912.1 hypothetical protein BDB00DRAFT_791516 [Zychaea mexicana]